MKANLLKILKAALVAAFWIGIWYFISLYVNREILVPSPQKTLETFLALAATDKFRTAVARSLLRIVSGFLLALAGGCLGAVLSYRFRFFEELFSPLLNLVRAIPVASFIILALVWIKTDTLPVFISFFMVLPIVWDSMLHAMRGVDTAALEAAAVDGAGKWGQIFFIIIPNLAPAFLSAAVTGLGFAWKSGVAAEVICRPPESLGNMLASAKNYLESAEVFAITATIIALSLVFEGLLKSLYRAWAKKHELI
ncbi:MAG: ABC transporter permease subunit [Clostridia bacterium]|nr:ABC transporter permease subunit [Clostridia bacterium]